MANPFLVLGGIAVGIVTAAFGVLAVPGWVASAQDASATNDLAGIRAIQAASVSSTGSYTEDLRSGEPGIKLTDSSKGTLQVDVADGHWCGTTLSESGSYAAIASSNTTVGFGATRLAAAADVGCVPAPCPAGQWTSVFWGNIAFTGDPIVSNCRTSLNYTNAPTVEPAPGVPPETYSVRHRGTLTGAGLYSFTVIADDTARVYIDGTRVYDQPGSLVDPRYFDVRLTAGDHDILVEHTNTLRTGKLDIRYTVGA